MAQCASCKAETELFENGLPVCLDCADARTKRKPPATDQEIRATLLRDVIEMTARNEQAIQEFETVTEQIPSGLPQPDGVQRIKNASAKLANTRKD